ncbi:aminopeptidase P N-terminal domain-containing protein, partial [Candidatus Babeliales bacterium]|nr:aminopeptidase P N-terminal domain-containing protein [Candidatus Babeliales bacterium]
MDVFRNRREQLINNIHEIKDNDLIILFSGFESSRTSFRPSSCAYYLTGIEDSGVVITIAKSGRMQAFVPRYGVDRGLWCGSRAVDDAWWKQAGFDSVNYLGEKISGYSLGMPIKEQSVSNLLDSLKKTVSQGGQLLTLGSLHKNIGNEQYIFMSQ